MNSMTFYFEKGDEDRDASWQFLSGYRDVVQLLSGGDIEAATERLTGLDAMRRTSLSEDALYWWLKFLYLEATQSPDTKQMKDCLKRAIGHTKSYLPGEFLVGALQSLYQLQVQDAEMGDAIQTYERLRVADDTREVDFYEQVEGEMRAHVQSIKKIVEGHDILSFSAQVEQNAYWIHRLLRSSFSIERIDGSLELVDIRCSVRAGRFPAVSGEVHDLPSSWEDCAVYVKGEPGATFLLVEYPDSGER